MNLPLFSTLRDEFDDLVQRAAVRCCMRKISALKIPRAMPVQDKVRRIGEWLDDLGASGVFNGTVLIARRGSVVLEKSYGFADVERRVPLSSNASFSLASVSKHFTGVAIMVLAQQGKLGLDDRLDRHIPELPDFGHVTIRQLLHHTSGIPDHMELAEDDWDSGKVLTCDDAIALLARHRPRAQFAPGARFDYSNTGYVLLGEIVTRASGLSFPDFMEREIFGPLGMKDSAAYNLTCKVCPLQTRAYGFRLRFGCYGKPISQDLNYLDGVFGDGGIYSSARDLARWDAALREGTLIPRNVYAQAYEPARLNDGKSTTYGFGWEIKPPSIVDHLGEWEGFTTYLCRDLRKETLLVVLSNKGPSACVDEISMELGAAVEDL
jgi:CubicO group peptidase (beta-lactamase class C family)